MTQRVEHTTVMDRLAIDDLVTGYAIAVDDGDWTAYRALFVPEGHVDYRSAGGIAGGVTDVADWLAEMMRRFPVRQHLIVNRRIGIELRDGGAPGDTATVQADYLNPMHLAGPQDAPPATGAGVHPGAAADPRPGVPADLHREHAGAITGASAAPNYTCAGRYAFAARRATEGWRLSEVVVHEKWRQLVPARD
ncbi:nuclear transport factor 2 family protein [Streptomyces monomycini]|uniref:nuclear transport factor 2 family protein n=1 Tax=Streptomyces monomycini TaxID=371720 RepID=UPI0004AA9F4C|nr:nuclear transport factor 2 family protein [Streptomyces monomycini]